MFLRRDFLDAWIVAASGSTNVDPDQCGDVAVPVPCKRGVDADVTSPGESTDLGRDDRLSREPFAHRVVSGRLTVYRDRAITSADKFVSQPTFLNVIATIQIKNIAAMSSIQFWTSIPAMSNSPIKNCEIASIPKTFTRRSG